MNTIFIEFDFTGWSEDLLVVEAIQTFEGIDITDDGTWVDEKVTFTCDVTDEDKETVNRQLQLRPNVRVVSELPEGD